MTDVLRIPGSPTKIVSTPGTATIISSPSPNGAAGAQGLAGPTGPTGPTGPAGATGPTGAGSVFLQEITNDPVDVVGAGGTEVFSGLAFTTTEPTQDVLLSFTASRENTSASGTGSYTFKVDGTTYFDRTVHGDVRSCVCMDLVLTVSAGAHVANVEAAETVGDETVNDGATLTVQGASS